MSDGPEIALLCGLCPTRRVLCYLHSIRPGRVYAAPGKARRERRPSVEGDMHRVFIGVSFRGVVNPVRYRCRRGHPWTIGGAAVLAAYTAAVEAGRQELVAGVDV